MTDDDPDPNSCLKITDCSFGHVGVGDETFLDRYRAGFGSSPKRIAWMDQVHGANIEYVGESNEIVSIFPETDGLWTDQSDLMLVTKTADCVPVLLRNDRDHLIAVLHCGWRSFFAGIIENFAKIMKEKNISLKNFAAFLGPHLRVNDFEVQQDFVDQIPKDKLGFLKKEGGEKYYDITSGVISTLGSVGITTIKDSCINTYDNPKFFSYRRWIRLPEKVRPSSYSTFANCISIS